jgi:hypothetical protein
MPCRRAGLCENGVIAESVPNREHKKVGASPRNKFGKTLSAVQSAAVQLSSTPGPEMLCVYQFKVVLRGISPMIWRRLLLRSDHSIADLHYTIQIAMGWRDSHLG